MSAAFVAELSAGDLCPEVTLSVGFAGAQLDANLTAALAIQVSVGVTPPTLAAQLTATLAVVTEIQATLSAGIALGLPGVSFNASVAAALVAKAELALGNLSILIGLLGGPAMFVYSYSGGTLGTVGSDLSAAITATPPPGLTGASPVSGILLGADPTSWSSISPFFGGA